MTMPRIGFAGMTHLGLVSAAGAAEKGFAVVAFDPGPGTAAALARGKFSVLEPELPELVQRNAPRLRFTAELSDLADCDVVYVAPDVPTDDLGQSDLAPLCRLLDSIEGALSDRAVTVILSQVPPAFTRGRWRADRALYYQVETLVFGRAVERTLNPERFIIGCADPAAPLPAAYGDYLARYGCPVLPMRFESAELAKISINMCLVASVSVANMMAELCERIGADWAEIMPSLRLDRRIGAYAYLSPGLGIAGGNLERDIATVFRLAERSGSDVGTAHAWVANSRHRRRWPLRLLHETVLSRDANAAIAVLGLAYKEDTASTKNSPALALLADLSPFAVRVYDPAVAASPEWHPNLAQAPSALAACEGVQAVAIMTPWREFRDIDPRALARRMAGNTVLDPYRMLDAAGCRAAGLEYATLGVT